MVNKLFFRFFEVVRAVLLLEAFDSSGRIYVLLLTRIERVAGRADFSVNFAYGASRFEGIAAAAADHDLRIFRMYFFLHN